MANSQKFTTTSKRNCKFILYLVTNKILFRVNTRKKSSRIPLRRNSTKLKRTKSKLRKTSSPSQMSIICPLVMTRSLIINGSLQKKVLSSGKKRNSSKMTFLITTSLWTMKEKSILVRIISDTRRKPKVFLYNLGLLPMLFNKTATSFTKHYTNLNKIK